MLLILCYVMLEKLTDLQYLHLLFVVAALILNYLFIRNLLVSTVFRKIKVIYKIISENKLTRLEKANIDINSQSLDQVRRDVENWARSTQEEIKNLKSLEQYRKDFVGNISHELKTPLFSIQGYLHTLLDGGIYDEKINLKYLERATINVDRLQNIIDDLETINKLESEKAMLEKTDFDVAKLTSEIFEDLTALAKKKNIALKYKSDTLLIAKVKANKDAIRQVINNLIVNSIKYGKDGGETTVGFYNAEKQILIEVSDNSYGIEEKHLKHLFDRFYRVDNSRARKIGGSGLGLSIVKHILEAHNQTISVRSTPGLGSTFGFTLKKA